MNFKKRTLTAITLLSLLAIVLFNGCSEDDPLTPEEEHFEAFGVVFFMNGTQIASIYKGITSDSLKVTAGSSTDVIQIKFYDEDQNILEPPEDEKTLNREVDDTNIAEISEPVNPENNFQFILEGIQQGETTAEFFLMHEGHSDFRSGNIPVIVE